MQCLTPESTEPVYQWVISKDSMIYPGRHSFLFVSSPAFLAIYVAPMQVIVVGRLVILILISSICSRRR